MATATSKKIKVGIAPDAIQNISKVAITQAIEELIWNAIDAEATKIEVDFGGASNVLLSYVSIKDDGHGISVDEAERVFGCIGGSSKRERRTSPKLERPYHGKEGKGRYKAFSIGSRVRWNSKTLQSGQVLSFSVQLDQSTIENATITSPQNCTEPTGCEVTISELRKEAPSLRSPENIESLTSRLAPYLIAQPGIVITYDGQVLDVRKPIVKDSIVSVEYVNAVDSEVSEFKLRILEWESPRKPALFLCDEQGVALDEIALGVNRGRFSITAYVVSGEVRRWNDESRLASGDLDEQVRAVRKAARNAVQSYVRARQAEEASVYADQIRIDGVYPYPTQPVTPIEIAEQQVFDICAATIHQMLPGFDSFDKESRRFAYRILREALESNPTNVGKIFSEVLKLSEEQQEDLVYLLDRTSLSAIIQTSKTVDNRLRFLSGLEQILHNHDMRGLVKERTQLHKILLGELWLFGDEYAYGADDVSLKSVMKAHREIMGMVDVEHQLPKDTTGLNDIPDIFLWQQYRRGQQDEYENLVIELKRPTVNISLDHLNQVKKYANAILDDKHFDKSRTHWTFYALSDGIARDALNDVRQADRSPGHVVKGDRYDIWVVTWAQVIQKAKVRLEWLKDRLNIAVRDDSDGMAYLQSKYSHLLPREVSSAAEGK